MTTEEKLDQILAHSTRVDISIAKLEVNMSQHMRRTELNEKAIFWLYASLIIMATGAVGSLIMFTLGHVKLI